MFQYAKVLVNKNAISSAQESINIGKDLLQRKLTAHKHKVMQFEQNNHMDTETFVNLFNQGKLEDSADYVRWDYYAQAACVLEKKISDIEGIRYES
jgi:hypothetical protein